MESKNLTFGRKYNQGKWERFIEQNIKIIREIINKHSKQLELKRLLFVKIFHKEN